MKKCEKEQENVRKEGEGMCGSCGPRENVWELWSYFGGKVSRSFHFPSKTEAAVEVVQSCSGK